MKEVFDILTSSTPLGVALLLLIIFYFLLSETLKSVLQREVKRFEQGFTDKLEKFKAEEIKLNLETSQYIQVITAERIKWLEKIREDLANIISLSCVGFSWR